MLKHRPTHVNFFQQDRFRHVLVTSFKNTNTIQYAATHYGGDHGTITAGGWNDDRLIYGLRGPKNPEYCQSFTERYLKTLVRFG